MVPPTTFCESKCRNICISFQKSAISKENVFPFDLLIHLLVCAIVFLIFVNHQKNRQRNIGVAATAVPTQLAWHIKEKAPQHSYFKSCKNGNNSHPNNKQNSYCHTMIKQKTYQQNYQRTKVSELYHEIIKLI